MFLIPALPRLIKPGVLANMKRSSVRDLLSPFTRYFESRGVPLGAVEDENFDLTQLFEVLASPIASTPPELVERLELLDLIAETQSALNFELRWALELAERSDGVFDPAIEARWRFLWENGGRKSEQRRARHSAVRCGFLRHRGEPVLSHRRQWH